MVTVSRSFGAERLVDLERTVDSLNGQLREMQLYRVKSETLTGWLWRNLMSLKGGQEFMSTVCNRRARPNARMVVHADPRA